MSALPPVSTPRIDSIPRRKEFTKQQQPQQRNPNNERSSFLAGKKLQGAVMDAFDRHGTKSERERIADMRLCLRDQLWKECPEGHEGRLNQTHFCGQRMCPICQKRRSILAKKRYRPVLTQALAGDYTTITDPKTGEPKRQRLVALFVTLTWPSLPHLDAATVAKVWPQVAKRKSPVKKTTKKLSEDAAGLVERGKPLGLLVDVHAASKEAAPNPVSRMWEDLAKLKRQPWWEELVKAETWSLEFTFSPAFGHHPHAHGIIMIPVERYEECVAAYKAAGISKADSARWWADHGPIPKPVLSEAWQQLSGAPFVHVQMIRPRRKAWGNQQALNAALDECLKYPMKETDYLSDRKLRPDELAEIDREDRPGLIQGEIYDREQALVELYRAIRGRCLTNARGAIRGKLKEAMKEVEEATAEELLRMDVDEMVAVATTCSCCNAQYVERQYIYRAGGYDLVDEQPLGTAFVSYDGEARRVIDMEHQRQAARKVGKSAGRAWTRFLNDRRKTS